MAWWYLVDGAVRFPSSDGPNAWRKARLASWRGTGKVTVGLALEWITKDVIFDESAPPKLCTAYFLDVDDDSSIVTLRGLIHRDDADAVLAVLDVAAQLGAVGKVLLDHGLDPHSGLRIELAKGKRTWREGRVKMPPGVVDEIDRESAARARRLGRERARPAPKPTTNPKPKERARKARRE
jgi:hypothetical protein